MAEQHTTAHKQVPASTKLDPAEVNDERDTSPRTAPPDLSGRRVRAIPYQNASTVKVLQSDFKKASNGDIDHPTVTWDFRVNDFTVPVGDKEGELSSEAAEFLTKNYPTDFEYINDGKDDK